MCTVHINKSIIYTAVKYSFKSEHKNVKLASTSSSSCLGMQGGINLEQNIKRDMDY